MVPVIRADLLPLITSILGDNRESEVYNNGHLPLNSTGDIRLFFKSTGKFLKY